MRSGNFLANSDSEHVQGPPRDLTGYGRHPPKLLWPGETHVAVQVAVNYEVGSEYSWPMGDQTNELLGEMVREMPEGIRDLSMESVFEYESRVGCWRLLRLFRDLGVPTTWFAAAVALERNTELARAVAEEGHETCSHGYRWAEHFHMTESEEREAIDAAVKSIEFTTGQRPVGWYSRHCPSIRTRELLVEYGGFMYDSDAYNDDLPYYVTVGGRHHLVIPYCMDANDSRFVRGTGFATGTDFYDYLMASYRFLAREAAITGTARVLSIGVHPRLVGRPGRADALGRFLEAVSNDPRSWLARRADIAEFWLQHFPPSTFNL